MTNPPLTRYNEIHCVKPDNVALLAGLGHNTPALKKASETGKMTVESLWSLANHYGALEHARKSVLTTVSMSRSFMKQILNVFLWICSRTCV